jgi:malate dehydrogenase (oxaloacetate-decarboxylating)(NADP+)
MYYFLIFKSLSKQVSKEDLDLGRIYPPLKSIREVSIQIACDIMKWYYKNNNATLYPKPSDFDEYLRKQLYDTTYSSYVPNTWKYPEEHQKPRSYDQVI